MPLVLVRGPVRVGRRRRCVPEMLPVIQDIMPAVASKAGLRLRWTRRSPAGTGAGPGCFPRGVPRPRRTRCPGVPGGFAPASCRACHGDYLLVLQAQHVPAVLGTSTGASPRRYSMILLPSTRSAMPRPTLSTTIAVRRDLAAHHGQAQAPAGLQHDLGPVPAGGADGEHHACGTGTDGLLDHHGHFDGVRIDVLFGEVGQDAAGKDADVALVHVLQDLVRPDDVDPGFELAGEAGADGIFRRGAGAHGHRDVLRRRFRCTASRRPHALRPPPLPGWAPR